LADAAAGAVRDQEPAGRSAPAVSAANLEAYALDRLRAARAFPKERLLHRTLRLAKTELSVWFASEQFADTCEAKLKQHDASDPSARQVEIYAMDATLDGWESPAIYDVAEGFSSRGFERILAAGNYRGFYHHDAPSWQFYDPTRSLGVQTLPSPLGVPPWETGSPLRLFLHWAYAAAGMRLTHAATLGLRGRGVLIAGPSGSGKSATTIAGLMNGLDSVGDDYVLLEGGARPTAHSVFRVLKQDRRGLQRAGVVAEDIESARLNWHGKVEFDTAKIAPRGLTDRMEIVAILIPEIGGFRQTEWRAATTREAALALTPSAVFQLPGDAAEGFGFLAAIARQLPCHRVRLSQDPGEIANSIGSFLTRESRDAG
jgi:hypothetical protein